MTVKLRVQNREDTGDMGGSVRTLKNNAMPLFVTVYLGPVVMIVVAEE